MIPRGGYMGLGFILLLVQILHARHVYVPLRPKHASLSSLPWRLSYKGITSSYKKIYQWVPSSVSPVNFDHLLLLLRSTSSCWSLLPRFSSLRFSFFVANGNVFRKAFDTQKMWPFQLVFLHFTVSTMFLSSFCCIYCVPFLILLYLLCSFPHFAVCTMFLSSFYCIYYVPFLILLYLLWSFPHFTVSTMLLFSFYCIYYVPFLILLCLLCSFSHFTVSTMCLFLHNRSNWASASFCSTTFKNYPGISDLLSEMS